ncbi:MAG: trypsin-like peptidase domain-containing protein [Acidobacteriaceae bacterium]|nr:trypsin-like peptidase domain-containing protein [Acidobacteriaceae bacterium]
MKQSQTRITRHLLVLGAILAFCGLRAKADDFSRTYEKVISSVVTIQSDKGSGSGFCVRIPDDSSWLDRTLARSGGTKTVFVTNAHVVPKTDSNEGRRLTIIGSNDKRYVGFVNYQDPQKDIAFVSCSGLTNCDDIPPVLLASADPKPGIDAFAIGSPGIGVGNRVGLATGSVTRGTVSRVWSREGLVQIDTPVNHGNSGGPLFDMNGVVIGMVTMYATAPGTQERLPGVNIAISPVKIGAMLSDYARMMSAVQPKDRR